MCLSNRRSKAGGRSHSANRDNNLLSIITSIPRIIEKLNNIKETHFRDYKDDFNISGNSEAETVSTHLNMDCTTFLFLTLELVVNAGDVF